MVRSTRTPVFPSLVVTVRTFCDLAFHFPDTDAPGEHLLPKEPLTPQKEPMAVIFLREWKTHL